MNLKTKKAIFLTGLILSVIGIIATLYAYVIVNSGSIGSGKLLFGPIFAYIFPLIGAPIMGYEGSGTPLNIGINIGFYASMILMIVFLTFLIRTLSAQKKMKKA